MASDKMEYMILQAYSDLKFQNKSGDEYKAMINPDSFSKTMQASYNRQNCISNSISAGNFSNMSPIDYSFTLLLDGTGIVSNGKEKEVKDELKKLSSVCFSETQDGKGYEPNFVAITYCNEIFHCVVTSLKTDYTLFKPNGMPLRAKVTCSFQSISDKEPGTTPEVKESGSDDTSTDSFEDVLSTAENESLDSLFDVLLKN